MVQGIDTIVPVDVYVPGCPPRPEGLIYGLMMIQEKIRQESLSRHFEHRAEDPATVAARRGADAREIRGLTGPFGNSTQQEQRSRRGPSPPRPRPATTSSADTMSVWPIRLFVDSMRSRRVRKPPTARRGARGRVGRLRERSSVGQRVHGLRSSETPIQGDRLHRRGPDRRVDRSGEAAWRSSPGSEDDAGQRYDMMSDVTGVDYGGGRPVEVVYQMFSTVHKRALRVRCRLPRRARDRLVVGLWASANWLEREVYDLFGVTFKGHPDLRRILMPQDYAEGHPLRKDFPLRGRFSRAPNRPVRALAQDVERFYGAETLVEGGEPQEVPEEIPAAPRATAGADALP